MMRRVRHTPAATLGTARMATGVVALSVVIAATAVGGRAAAAPGVPVTSGAALVADPASMVNTLVQTGAGNNFPGAQAPMGMVQFSPNMHVSR